MNGLKKRCLFAGPFLKLSYGMFLNSLCLPVAYSKIKEKARLKVGEDQSYILTFSQSKYEKICSEAKG